MIPFGLESVTILHRSESGYARSVLTGCSWRSAKLRSMIGMAAEKSEETVCRIPADQIIPDVGDVLILGDVDAAAGSEIELVRLMDELRRDGVRAIRVTQVRDNSRGVPLPHFAVTGV